MLGSARLGWPCEQGLGFVGLPPPTSKGKRSSTQGFQVWAEGSVRARGEQRAPRREDGSSPVRSAIGLDGVSHWKLLDSYLALRNALEITNCSKFLNPQLWLELPGFTCRVLGNVTPTSRKDTEKSDLCSLQGASRKQSIILPDK